MIGAVIIGLILDKSPFKNRKHRGYVGLGFTAAACFAIWGATLSYQLTVSWHAVFSIFIPTDPPSLSSLEPMDMRTSTGATRGLPNHWPS